MDYFIKNRIKKLFNRAILISIYFFFGSSFVQATSKLPKEFLKQPFDINNISAIVSEADASRYRVIFGLQKNGDWVAADKIILTLRNKVLIGHLLSQRYLHPTKYRSRYKELKGWLDKYSDHPDAGQMYKLALKRRPKTWKLPKKPISAKYIKPYTRESNLGYIIYNPQKRLRKTERQERKKLSRQMHFYLRKGWTKSYKKLVRSDRVKRLFHIVELDRVKARLAAGYYADGRDQWAYDWANRAIQRSGKYLPEAHWVAALSAWRLARFSVSRKHFEAVSSSVYSSPWLVSAGAFWAARASIKIRKPALYNRYLETASAYPRTFYGILARRLLGLELKYNWTSPPLETEALLELAKAPGGQRAISLLQIGEDKRAERELKQLFRTAKPELARAMMVVIDRAEMPSLAMRISNMLVVSGSSLFDSTTYPAPIPSTENGNVSHRSLILALIRQESRFNPKAKSHRGARGLLQLMPRTASFVARDRRLRGSKENRDALFDPKTNLSLGQKYINILLNDKGVKGDLFKMLAAWNGGPGNLNKWIRNVKYGSDPLLFIESIPSKETRIFIERVLSNYWIYESRFGNDSSSLDFVASGKWPGYRAYPGVEIELAED